MSKSLSDITAERSWLACVVTEPRLFSDFRNINDDYFYSHENKVVFNKIFELLKDGRSVDSVTVFSGMSDSVQVNIFSAPFNTENIKDYGAILESKYLSRFLLKDINKVSGEIIGDESGDIHDVIGSLATRLINITNTHTNNDSLSHLSDVSDDITKMLKDARCGISDPFSVPTGIPPLSDKMHGFSAGDMVTIAARSQHGKTALALLMALSMSDAGKKIGFISLEMSKKQLYIRLMSHITGIDFQRIATGSFTDIEAAILYKSKQRIDASNLYIDDQAFMNEIQLMSVVRKMKYSFGVDAVFIDYIQLVETKGKHENRQREISVISRAIKGIAKELDIPVIALSQLKRDVDSRDNKRPTLSDIRESGSIEQDSDVIVFIYRPEVYGIQKWDDGVPTSGTAELIVGKFRNGETFSSRAAFIGRSMRFEKLSLDYNNKDSF